jgi:NAD(P)-dependent dehydrogenase (short-subunit alcohol dehydrogenase family)
MKCLATTQGPKIRVNAVLPGLLLTEWGLLYSKEKIETMKELAALKKVVSAPCLSCCLFWERWADCSA